jgi:hypothetical protein
MDARRETLLELEHHGWRSLCEGTGDQFYGAMLTRDAHMVLADGSIMTRDDVVTSLRDASAWDSYEIDDPLAVPIDDHAVMLIYTGTGHRPEIDFTGVMSSLYVRRNGGWSLAHYQQTRKS